MYTATLGTEGEQHGRAQLLPQRAPESRPAPSLRRLNIVSHKLA